MGTDRGQRSMVKSYVPDKGDIIWLHFTPQSGKEQAGHRPALVLSPARYNKIFGLCLVCPITSKVKGLPFEVKLTDSQEVRGVVLSDQIRNLDWRTRKASFIEKAPKEVSEEVLAKLNAILD